MDGTSGIPDKYAQTSTTFNIGRTLKMMVAKQKR
jgi:hypothetical protein